jgi:hypothetical protein
VISCCIVLHTEGIILRSDSKNSVGSSGGILGSKLVVLTRL